MAQQPRKTIALIAHDQEKDEMSAFAGRHGEVLKAFRIVDDMPMALDPATAELLLRLGVDHETVNEGQEGP